MQKINKKNSINQSKITAATKIFFSTLIRIHILSKQKLRKIEFGKICEKLAVIYQVSIVSSNV